MTAILKWRKYKYFPYEKRFAAEEVRTLFACKAFEEDRDGIRVPLDSIEMDAAKRMTYFSRIIMPNGVTIIPDQTRIEATAWPSGRERQSTRYSAHGLHEYKGKFNPQVVRSIGNRLNLKSDDWVLDPFSGSGTTLLECAHAGLNAVGIDRNPLAVMIGNAKVRALHLADGRLSSYATEIARRVRPWIPSLETNTPSANQIVSLLGPKWQEEIPGVKYLYTWFPEPVLAQVTLLRRVLGEVIDSRQD